MNIKPLKNYWVCVGPHNYAPHESIAYSKSRSIKQQISGGIWTWRKWKLKGWRCIKVNIEIEAVEKPEQPQKAS